MKKVGIEILSVWLIPVLLMAQPGEKRQLYDISKEKVLYTIGYAHLDTEQNWEFYTTINQYFRNTTGDNFKLLD